MACCCPAHADPWNPGRPVSTRIGCWPPGSPYTTWWPRLPRATRPCWRPCAPKLCPLGHAGNRMVAWIVDDTGIPKKAGIREVTFQTKPEMGREQIRPALASDLPRGVVLADAGYGMDTRFREGLGELGLPSVVGVQSTTSVGRVSSSRDAVHCRLWVPGGREKSFSPRRVPEGSPWRESGSPPTIACGAARRPGRRFEAASIASIRSVITARLIRQLPGCPLCGARCL